jgi:hypothetical protein
MIADAALGWVITVLFAAVAVYFLLRIVAGTGWVDRIISLTHVVMAVVMLTMPWSWGMAIPVPLQAAVFTLAMLWYLYLLLYRPDAEIGPVGQHHQKSDVLWYHTIMMGSMLWMAVLMFLGQVPAASVVQGTSATDPSMPGMDMGGMDMSGTSAGSADPAGAVAHLASPGWAAFVSDLLAIFFAIAAVTFLTWLLRRSPAGARTGQTVLVLDQTAWAVMAGGMALAFAVMR